MLAAPPTVNSLPLLTTTIWFFFTALNVPSEPAAAPLTPLIAVGSPLTVTVMSNSVSVLICFGSRLVMLTPVTLITLGPLTAVSSATIGRVIRVPELLSKLSPYSSCSRSCLHTRSSAVRKHRHSSCQ